MFARILDDLKQTPSRLAERRETLSARRKQFTAKAKTQIKTVTGEGQERLWTLGTQALERVDSALERGAELPVVGQLSKGAHRVVSERLDALKQPPIPGYDEMNARDIIAAVKELDGRVALAAVRRHETETKARKTVLSAVEARIAALPAA